MQMMSLTPQMAEYFGLGQRSGALVTWVDQDSSVAKAGLKAGDVILTIGGDSVDNPSQAWRTLRQKAGETVEIKVMRDRREQSFTVQLDKRMTSSWVIEPGELEDLVIPAVTVEVPMPSIEIPAVPALAPMPNIRVTPCAVCDEALQNPYLNQPFLIPKVCESREAYFTAETRRTQSGRRERAFSPRNLCVLRASAVR